MVVIHDLHHPLHGQRVITGRHETIHNVVHYRFATEGRQQRFVPESMCDPHSFDASPVQQLVIDSVVLFALQTPTIESLQNPS